MPAHLKPCPPDFRETFLRDGWDARQGYGVRTDVFRRWLAEAGGEDLRAERRLITGSAPKLALRSENRARRYVLGRTLTGKSAA
jgi:hypothetical protein